MSVARDTDPQLLVNVELLEALVDTGECWFDHNGGCQEHGYLSLKHGEKCPQFELKEMLAAVSAFCQNCNRPKDSCTSRGCCPDCDHSVRPS